jgi:hypothetical protein
MEEVRKSSIVKTRFRIHFIFPFGTRLRSPLFSHIIKTFVISDQFYNCILFQNTPQNTEHVSTARVIHQCFLFIFDGK